MRRLLSENQVNVLLTQDIEVIYESICDTYNFSTDKGYVRTLVTDLLNGGLLKKLHGKSDWMTKLCPYVAAFADDEIAVDSLNAMIAEGADINKACGIGAPMAVAMLYQRSRVVRVLIDAGVELCWVDDYRHDKHDLYLVDLVKFADLDLIQHYINCSGNSTSVNAYGTTPVHCAVMKGDIALLGMLLAAGSAYNAEDNYGCTPLRSAVKLGRADMVALLLDKHKPNELESSSGNVPLLQVAARKGYNDAVELLVRKGYNINEENDDNTQKSYHRMWDSCRQSRRDDLLGGEGRCDYKFTALHQAAKTDSVTTVTTLIRLGADVDALDDHNRTPLHIAAMHGNLDVIAALLHAGAKIDAKSETHYTALMTAAAHGKLDAVKYLLHAGASIQYNMSYFFNFYGLRVSEPIKKAMLIAEKRQAFVKKRMPLIHLSIMRKQGEAVYCENESARSHRESRFICSW